MTSRPEIFRLPALRRRFQAARVLAGLMLFASLVRGPAAEPIAAPIPPPRLDPDYTGIVIPPNLAPLNFVVREPGRRFEVKLHGAAGASITLRSSAPQIRILLRPWRELLQANLGGELYFSLRVQDDQGAWRTFATITNQVAREAIDGYLTYRLLHPQYSMYGNGTMGIYQRNLETFEQRTIFQIKEFGESAGACLNCHTFANRQPYPMALHIRAGKHGLPMLVAHDGLVTTVNRPLGYLAWHPNGKRLAFSINKLSLLFHSTGETRDVFDAGSDLGIYRVADNTFSKPAPIAQKEFFETWPSWSPDGRFLYFCRSPQKTMEEFRSVKYDLLRVSFDPDRDVWGTPEVLVSARDTGLSAGQPKASPDGRFVLFTLCGYGNFPVYQTNADLYLLDLGTRQYRPLECNSDQCDSWHSWSGNSRWIVFSSKRRDGFFSRPHFSYLDEAGRASKAFILPQADPTFYDSFVKTFNVPEFVTGPVTVARRDLFQAVFHPDHRVTPVSTTAESAPATPGGEADDALNSRSESAPSGPPNPGDKIRPTLYPQ